MRRLIFLSLMISTIIACNQSQKQLPYLGPLQVSQGDTSYYKVPEFTFMDQDSNKVSNETLQGKIYIADFFFTSCPSICPKMKKQMNRIYEKYQGNEEVQFVSHTIDIRHDTIPVLKAYSQKMDVEDASQWHFVWGTRDEIYDMAKAYFQTAYPDSTVPGGFVHSGQFALVDGQSHIRGFYNGTDAKEVDELMKDLKKLLATKDE